MATHALQVTVIMLKECHDARMTPRQEEMTAKGVLMNAMQTL